MPWDAAGISRERYLLREAKAALKSAKAAQDDNGWERSTNWYEARAAAVRRCQRRYDEAHQRWVDAGRPH